MRLQLKKIEDQVVVITGASSGIGLATALLAAEKGAKVILSSRNEADLRRIVDDIRSRGRVAEMFVADVAVDDEIQRLGAFAVERFGRIDTWVNNAGISIYGRLLDMHMDEKRRVMDVNFWGTVHGCKAAVKYMKNGEGAAIINVGSEVSELSIPLQVIYSSSKHAIKAYTDGLRLELEKDKMPIAVTLVKPAGIATPYLEHARNHMSERPTLPAPVYAPEVVARAIVRCAQRPTRSIFVGGAGPSAVLLEKIAPRFSDFVKRAFFFNSQKENKPKFSRSQEGLFQAPANEGVVRGEYSGHVMKTSLYTSAMLYPRISTLALVGLGGVLVGFWRKRKSQSASTDGFNLPLEVADVIEIAA